MTTKFRPMKGVSIEESDLPNLDYSLIVQPKLDGIRCCLIDGIAHSYSMKLIPNKHIRKLLSGTNANLALVDGELLLKGKHTFQQLVSAVMSEDGEPDFEYVTFDYLYHLTDNRVESETYANRLGYLTFDRPWIRRIDQLECFTPAQVLLYEKQCLEAGHEGIILRNPHSLYKCGRSTLKEQGMLKLKRFTDAEAEIIGFEELMVNQNKPTLNEHGLQERSSEQAGLISGNTLGALIVRGINGKFKDVTFKIGSGFDEETRDSIWRHRGLWMKKWVTFKYQDHGIKDKPRLPIYKGVREI